jgi:hypothetical protein
MRSGNATGQPPMNCFEPVVEKDYIADMGFWKTFTGRVAIVGELWSFVRYRKRYWLLPILIFLILLSLFIVLAEGSALAPFIYTVF